jgi:hypothetical protein
VGWNAFWARALLKVSPKFIDKIFPILNHFLLPII